NERSHWSGNGVHVEPESVFMIGRNMQLAPVLLASGDIYVIPGLNWTSCCHRLSGVVYYPQ
ncbi:hypothetical protein ACK318_08520, partial [Aeromonas dhakensis]|uniref:hypothetical protein n=1 Tax=Aeromonas dhakensis TaxID=196024 RepID=UPI00398785D3